MFRPSPSAGRTGRPRRARCRAARRGHVVGTSRGGRPIRLPAPRCRSRRSHDRASRGRRRRRRRSRSEEHTSELQSPYDIVCRLLLEKKKKQKKTIFDLLKKNNKKKIITT